MSVIIPIQYLMELGIPHHFFQRIILCVTVPTAYLNGVCRHLHGYFRGKVFGNGTESKPFIAILVQDGCGLMHQIPRSLYPDLHIGQHNLNRLKFSYGTPELFSLF